MSPPRSDRPVSGYAPSIRCYLFYGPDEASSRAFAAQIPAALGPDVERIDLAAARLRTEPGLLADEAASRSLFGSARCIRVDGVGDDCLAAVELLFAAAGAGDPIVLIGGALRKDSRLVKYLTAKSEALVRASYVPEAGEMAALAMRIGSRLGLQLDDEVAHRLAETAGGDRAILESEIAKIADYSDAAPDEPRRASLTMLDAIGGDPGDSDTDALVRALFAGDIRTLDRLTSGIGAEAAVPLARAVQRRLLAMAACRAEMDRGTTPRAAVERAGRAIFWRDRDGVARDLARWSSSRLARALERMSSLERVLKSSRGPGHLAAEQLYRAMARSVRR